MLLPPPSSTLFPYTTLFRSPPLPLPRPPAREAPSEHPAPEPCHRVDPPAHDRGRLHRVPDADPHVELPRARARLRRAQPRPTGEVLRAAAGAAAVQAAPDGRRVRSLLPARPVLP